jgi:hypothetical protein
MHIFFDKYCFRSTAASAQLLRMAVAAHSEGDEVRIFCTTQRYKTSQLEANLDFDDLCITKSFFHLNSTLKLYFGWLFFVFRNKQRIKSVYSQSSPGWNVIVHGFGPLAGRTTYVVQDVFPDGQLFALRLFYLRWLLWPLFYVAYRRIGDLRTISTDMQAYLRRQYRVESSVYLNPSTTRRTESKGASNVDTSDVGVRGVLRFGYSGNFSFAHGYDLPFECMKRLLENPEVQILFRGFGRNFDRLRQSVIAERIDIGGPMSSGAYQDFLTSCDAFLIFQGDGYERFCLSSKFNSLLSEGKPIIYVGPECDISRFIRKEKIGITISQQDLDHVDRLIFGFLQNLAGIRRRAAEVATLDLREYDVGLLHYE